MEFLYFVFGAVAGGWLVFQLLSPKENEGEFKVRTILKTYCKETGSHLLNNITLRLHDGSTTQIDHILITQKGILVIETKDYSGWIFGSEKQKHWTQVIYKKKTKFLNPLHQNYKHIMAVRKELDFLPREAVVGLVVFTDKSEFKTEFPSSVIHEGNLIDYVRKFYVETLSENRVQFCVGRLECNRMELTRKTDVEHRENLEQKFGS